MPGEGGGRSLVDLGGPIQQLIQQIQRNLSDEEMDMCEKVSVRQLAKVYDMIALEEDPEKILTWLKKEYCKKKGIETEDVNEKARKKVLAEGGRDPIAYFKYIEQKNIEFMEDLKKSQEERKLKREANIAERRRRREECMRQAKDDLGKEPIDHHDAVKNMKQDEVSDILGAFERFTSKKSTFDNSNSVQDSEWWKGDEYRRDYEKNGMKGSRWTSVLEGGSLRAPEAEIQLREEWYRVQCWWKSDTYRRNWLASRDAEWWKEEPYITDCLENGDDGTMWTAADELTGYNHRGHRRKAPKAELARRFEWYKANGPKGVVKTWCAMTEGSKDRCTLEEKYERDDYYKNGDWWKSEIYVNNVRDKPADCSALYFSSSSAMDQEWWKQPSIRADYEKGGVLWKAFNEEAAVRGLKDLASDNDVSQRENWFKTFWWKGEAAIKDYQKNGLSGKIWRASEPGSTSVVDAVQQRAREEWFLGSNETEWWKSPWCIQDWVDKGENGNRCTAPWRRAALEGNQDSKASAEVLKERAQYYKENFFKQNKYIKDFIAFGDKGVLWKSSDADAAKDQDWWKSPTFFSQWILSHRAFPSDFWKEPEIIADYWTNGAAGKKWTATNCLSASLDRGETDQASVEELVVREVYYKKYWWQQDEYCSDFVANGSKWKEKNIDDKGICSAFELIQRKNFYEKPYLKRVVLGYQRLLELDANTPVTGLFATAEERNYRDKFYRSNWYKTRNGLKDYAFKGDKSIYICGATYNDARALEGIEFATAIESASRMIYFDMGCTEYSADSEYVSEFIAAADWWQDPLVISDYINNGDNGKQWKANNAASGFCGLAENDTCAKNEQDHRRTFYNANYWKSQESLDDFRQNGLKGKIWTFSKAQGKGERVDEKELLLRAQILSGYPDKSWKENMEKNWWKAPEVRADYYANGEAGQLFCAVNAHVAMERLGARNEFKAGVSELSKRIEYYTNHPLSTLDGEFCHYFTLIEPFWLKPESVEDFWTNGSAGTKWNAANAAAFSCSLGNKYKASPEELRRREETLRFLFWLAPAYKQDFLLNGKRGVLWNHTEFDGSGDLISDKEEVLRICHYLRTSEKYWADCRYASENWWKSPEVRSDYHFNGAEGSLVSSATPAVAAMGLFRSEHCEASEEEKKKRINYYKTHPYRDGRVSEAFLSRELKRVKAMEELFWIHWDCLEDYTLHGAHGTMWYAVDAASASTGSALKHRATVDNIRFREEFFSKYWWKASKYRLDFLQNGFGGRLWTKTDPDGNGGTTTDEDILGRMCYYASGGLEYEKRSTEFALCWWKSGDAVAHYMLSSENSKYIKAGSPQVALSEAHNQEGMAASSTVVNNRIHYMIVVAPSNEAEDITDTQIMTGVVTVNDGWWKNEAYQMLYDSQRPIEHWKDVECIADYLEHGHKGSKCFVAGRISPTNKGALCSNEEKKEREAYYAATFWQSAQYRNDYEVNALKGTLWTSSQPNGKGKPISELELNVRMMFYQPSALWELAIDPGSDMKSAWCGLHEDMMRSQWYKEYWWKCALGGENSFITAANLSVFLNGNPDSLDLQASKSEIEMRTEYFNGMGANEWWQNPVFVSDFQKGGQGCAWNARTFKEATLSMGLESPADSTELERRKKWFEKNAWKSLEMIQDYNANGNKWRSSDPTEQQLREDWLKSFKPISKEEEKKRKEWLSHQLSDEELQVRRSWLLRRSQEARRIHRSELGDLLAQLNDGVRPSDDEIKAIESAIIAQRDDYSMGEGITQQEFLRSMVATRFYVASTEDEKLRSEQEALEALQKEEMDRLEEEAAHLAQEAQEELEAAGEEYVPFDAAADEEEQEYLDALAEEENARYNQNEDDLEVNDETWEQQLEDVEAEESVDEEAQDNSVERQRAMEEAFAANEYGGEMDEDDTEAVKGELEGDTREVLEDFVNNENGIEEAGAGWNDFDGDSRSYKATDKLQEYIMHPKDMFNPQYLKAFFSVMKYTPATSLINTSQKRIWVVDHFTRSFYNLTKNNRIRKEHSAGMLIQLEKNVNDCTRLRMLFYDASHSYDMQFVNANERERFYETASALRSAIRTYAPDMVGTDAEGTVCPVTLVDCKGDNQFSVVCKDTAGKPVQRQLVGECRLHVSKVLTEPLSIWCGTFNLGGHRPPKDSGVLRQWMPKDNFDIYVISAQEASYRRDENEWYDYVQNYLGKNYVPLASVFLWDTLLLIMVKNKHLLRITNTEVSTRETSHKMVCGNKGGIGISMQYLETSFCFCTCHLSARNERVALRNSILEEIFDNVALGVQSTDISSQFDHVFLFGDLNYRTDIDPEKAVPLIQEKKCEELLRYDQLNNQRISKGILHGFKEPTINFAPTYRFDVGSKMYALKTSPSYCDRVLFKSNLSTLIKCTSYQSVPDTLMSEHRPVFATFIVRCVRPVLSCFTGPQGTVPEFIFDDIIVKDYTGGIIKKPLLIIHTRFSSTIKPIKSTEKNTASPVWSKNSIPPVNSVTQVQEYLETCSILLIINDGGIKQENKKHRGTGTISLQGCVIGKENTNQTFESDILYHGKLAGKVCGSFAWQSLTKSEHQ